MRIKSERVVVDHEPDGGPDFVSVISGCERSVGPERKNLGGRDAGREGLGRAPEAKK